MRNKEIKTVNVGIMPLDQFKKRTLMIARGKYKPKKNEPTVWFPSLKSLASVLSEENQALLKLIIESKPKSIAALEPLTGRKTNNLLRTLRRMERYGLVELEESDKGGRGRSPLVPKVIYNMANIEVHWN